MERRYWRVCSILIVCAVLAACTPQAPPPKAGESSPAPAAAKTAPAPTAAPPTPATKAAPASPSPAAPAPSPATKAASPSPATKAASPAPATKAASPSPSPAAKAAPVPTVAVQTGTRPEPRGRLVFASEVAISPLWLDPLEIPTGIAPLVLQLALHDALVRPLPGNIFAPSLAETYEIAPDFRSATFRLRQGAKFHNGDPVTAEDVKFTFDNYKGANARALKDRTERVEVIDPRTVRFVFNAPFLDFLTLYGSLASSAGWIVPAKYYQQVGPDGFKQNPIGAGPYKFVRQIAGQEVELEAFTDYWRKAPNAKTLVIRGIPESSTRLASVESGEIDLMAAAATEHVDRIKANQQLQLAPVLTSNWWLEFPGHEKADSPFSKPQVRQAVSLAIDRQALIDNYTGGYGQIAGNWVTSGWIGAIELPKPEHNPARARQLLAEAGYPNGLDAGALTPFPANSALGESLLSQLREVGIRTQLNVLERAAFEQRRAAKQGAFPDGIMMNINNAGEAGNLIRTAATCNGAISRTCLPAIDDRFKQYEASVNPQERERLLREIQTFTNETHLLVPLFRNVLLNVQGPRIANKWDEIWGAMALWLYVGPYEDIQLRN